MWRDGIDLDALVASGTVITDHNVFATQLSLELSICWHAAVAECRCPEDVAKSRVPGDKAI